MTAKATHKW